MKKTERQAKKDYENGIIKAKDQIIDNASDKTAVNAYFDLLPKMGDQISSHIIATAMILADDKQIDLLCATKRVFAEHKRQYRTGRHTSKYGIDAQDAIIDPANRRDRNQRSDVAIEAERIETINNYALPISTTTDQAEQYRQTYIVNYYGYHTPRYTTTARQIDNDRIYSMIHRGAETVRKNSFYRAEREAEKKFAIKQFLKTATDREIKMIQLITTSYDPQLPAYKQYGNRQYQSICKFADQHSMSVDVFCSGTYDLFYAHG